MKVQRLVASMLVCWVSGMYTMDKLINYKELKFTQSVAIPGRAQVSNVVTCLAMNYYLAGSPQGGRQNESSENSPTDIGFLMSESGNQLSEQVSIGSMNETTQHSVR